MFVDLLLANKYILLVTGNNVIFQTIRKLQMSESELERAEERAENAERSRSQTCILARSTILIVRIIQKHNI